MDTVRVLMAAYVSSARILQLGCIASSVYLVIMETPLMEGNAKPADVTTMPTSATPAQGNATVPLKGSKETSASYVILKIAILATH